MKVRIESDGTPYGTRIIDETTGKDLGGLFRALTFSHTGGRAPELILELGLISVSAFGLDAKVLAAGLGAIKAIELESGERIEMPALVKAVG